MELHYFSIHKAIAKARISVFQLNYYGIKLRGFTMVYSRKHIPEIWYHKFQILDLLSSPSLQKERLPSNLHILINDNPQYNLILCNISHLYL